MAISLKFSTLNNLQKEIQNNIIQVVDIIAKSQSMQLVSEAFSEIRQEIYQELDNPLSEHYWSYVD